MSELNMTLLKSTIINVFIALLALLNAGCTVSGERIDLSEIDLEIEILRLDRDLFAVDIDSIPEHIPAIEKKYGEFFDIYNNLIIRIGSSRSPAYPESLKSFLTDFDIYRLHNEVERIFPDLREIEAELETAFKYYRHYFPDYTVPQIYTYISGFNQTVVAAENQFGIGLDKYLGSGHKFYYELQLPEYQRNKMHPGKIPSDCIIAWAMTEFELDDTDGHLLSHIIYHGKLLYFADAVLPEQHDTLKTGISFAGLEWCKNNERQMWTFLVENKLLFRLMPGLLPGLSMMAPSPQNFPEIRQEGLHCGLEGKLSGHTCSVTIRSVCRNLCSITITRAYLIMHGTDPE